jgi:hypothetical protein
MGKNQSSSNLTNIIKQDANGNISFVSGSTTLMSVSSSGAITTTGVISGSNALSASYAVNATSASYASTSSYASAFNVAGTLTATTLVVQTVTSSVIYSSGSNVFGNNIANTQVMTGSVLITGSVGIGTSSPSNLLTISSGNGTFVKFGDAGYLSQFSSGSYIIGSAEFNSAGAWTARSTSAAAIAVNEVNTGAIVFITNTSLTSGNSFTPTERMRITNTGNVGIGITAPTQPLHVYATTTTTSTFFETNAANSYIGLKSTSGTNYIGNVSYAMTFEAGGAERMRISSAGNVGIGTITPTTILTIRKSIDSSAYGAGTRMIDFKSFFPGFDTETVKASIYAGVSSLSESRTDNGYLVFMTANSGTLYERMRIEKSGQVQVKQAGDTHSDGFSLINTAGNAWNFVTGGDNQLYFGLAGTSRGVFATNGVYTAISDINKKKDFEDSTIGLNAVLGLKPTLYRMKDEDESIEKQLGFIAQEVKDFIPQAYSESVNGDETFIGLTQMPIIAALVKAIQELKAEIDELKNK